MSGPRRIRHDPRALMESEKSVWDIYNNLADIRDSELIKDWNHTLNFLLIFASIFAAVLIALIVESMKLLQEDPRDTTNAILVYISSQLANSTMPAYQTTAFHVPQYAVVVNALLFASLCCSLIAALAAVLALQWVNEYDAGLDTVDSEKRALIRHLRYAGVGTWKMAEIVAVLPILLHSSVFLFFAGAIAWLRSVHQLISWICLVGAAIAVVFYIVTALLSANFESAPFRSPMARFFRYVPYLLVRSTLNTVYLVTRWGKAWFLISAILPYIYHHFIDARGAEEERATKEENRRSTLIWTANHVVVATQSTHRLLQILKDAFPLYVESAEQGNHWTRLSMESRWVDAIFHVAKHYMDKATSDGLSAADLEEIRLLLSIWVLDYFKTSRARYDPTGAGWFAWTHLYQLVGPLPSSKVLQLAELDFIMAIIKVMWLKDGEQAAKQLVETIKAVEAPTTAHGEELLSYSINCLSTVVFTRGPFHTYRQAASYIAEMVSVPPGQLSVGMRPRGILRLSLSALHSLAFNSLSRNDEIYWASKHRFCLASDLGSNFDAVKTLHSAITSNLASKVALANSKLAARSCIQGLSRLLAYTPFEIIGDRDFVRACDVIKEIPSSMHCSPYEMPELAPLALTSLVWLQKLNEIPRIHEYLEVFLLCRRRFPELSPVWRDWISYTHTAWKHNEASLDDQQWLDQMQKDRRIVEVFAAFDRLVAHGCSTAQHLVLVQLLVDDLLHESVDIDEHYYSEARKAALRGVKDPALRLIAARAAKMAYSESLPPLETHHWLSGPWVVALEYWCGQYDDIDATLDEALLAIILSQPNITLHSLLSEVSSRNTVLQNRMRQVLEAKLNQPSDVNAALLVHTAARAASWFPEYLTPVNVMRIARLLDPDTPVNARMLPLLSFLVPFLHTPEDLEGIVASSRRALSNGPPYIGQTEVDNMYAAFDGLLREPPPWIQALQSTHEHSWNGAVESLKEILDLLLIRTQEAPARAVLRWNGRTRIPSGRRDGDLRVTSIGGEVVLESGGFGIENVERPFSCTASWGM